MMKKLFLPMALGALLTGELLAGQVFLNWGVGNDHSTSGGEFAISGALGNFNTFCIEHTENVALNTQYYYSISGGAIAGGFSGGTGNPKTDIISKGTSYLYRKFWDGTLKDSSNQLYKHEAADQNDLQRAIWWLEGEIGTTDALGHPSPEPNYDPTNPLTPNRYLEKAKSALGVASLADLKADAALGANGVYALNLYTSKDSSGKLFGNAQDQLIVVPDGGMTLAMLGMACASFGLMRRKF